MQILKNHFDVPPATQIVFEFSDSELLLEGFSEKQRDILSHKNMAKPNIEQMIIALAALYTAQKRKPKPTNKGLHHE